MYRQEGVIGERKGGDFRASVKRLQINCCSVSKKKRGPGRERHVLEGGGGVMGKTTGFPNWVDSR